jgi:hypothetical protein
MGKALFLRAVLNMAYGQLEKMIWKKRDSVESKNREELSNPACHGIRMIRNLASHLNRASL